MNTHNIITSRNNTLIQSSPSHENRVDRIHQPIAYQHLINNLHIYAPSPEINNQLSIGVAIPTVAVIPSYLYGLDLFYRHVLANARPSRSRRRTENPDVFVGQVV